MTTPPSLALDMEPEAIKARIRLIMAAHVEIAPRGFDSQRDRAALQADFDALYEDWLAVMGHATFDA